MANTYLTRTHGTPTNAKKHTFSVWVKLSGDTTDHDYMFGIYNNSNDRSNYYVTSASDFTLRNEATVGGTNYRYFYTNRKFRDCNAWYNIIVAVDTTQATESDRVKVYVNGVQETSFSTTLYPSQNSDDLMNSSGSTVYVGQRGGSYGYLDGSMSHMHFIDGTAYDASAFGETDATTGEWKIKTSPSVTYGNNGFFILKDGNTITDSSTNSNNFSLGGGTLTKTEDCPSNVFATLNRLHMDDPASQYFLSNGNLRQNVTNNDGHRETGFTLHPKGLKGYFEVKCTVDPNFHLGLQNAASKLGQTNYYTLASPNYYYMQSSNPVKISYANGGSSATHIADYFSQISVGDIIGCAFDFTGTNKNVWFHKNGTYGNNGSGVGNPATGAYPAMTSTQLTADEYEFIVSPNTGSGNGQLDFNFGNGYFGTTAVSSAGTNASGIGIFEYDVPSGGYTALSTKGLNL